MNTSERTSGDGGPDLTPLSRAPDGARRSHVPEFPMTDAPQYPRAPAYKGPQRVFSGMQPTNGLHLGNYLGALQKFVALQDKLRVHLLHRRSARDHHRARSERARQSLPRSRRRLRRRRRRSEALDHLHPIRRARAQRACVDLQLRRPHGLARTHDAVQGQGRQGRAAFVRWLVRLPGAAGGRHSALQGDARARRRRPEAAPGAVARHRGKSSTTTTKRPTFFPLPDPLIQGPGARMMSLREGTKKMSKSDPSDMTRINMTDDADTIMSKIKKATTDSRAGAGERRGLEGPGRGREPRRHLRRRHRTKRRGRAWPNSAAKASASSSRRWPKHWPRQSSARSPPKCAASTPIRPR